MIEYYIKTLMGNFFTQPTKEEWLSKERYEQDKKYFYSKVKGGPELRKHYSIYMSYEDWCEEEMKWYLQDSRCLAMKPFSELNIEAAIVELYKENDTASPEPIKIYVPPLRIMK